MTDGFEKYRKFTTLVAAGGVVLMEMGGHHLCVDLLGESQCVMPMHVDQTPGHENGPTGQFRNTLVTTSGTSFVR